MNLILFCVFLTFSIGLFLLLAGLLRLPTLKTSRVMMDTGKEGKQVRKENSYPRPWMPFIWMEP